MVRDHLSSSGTTVFHEPWVVPEDRFHSTYVHISKSSGGSRGVFRFKHILWVNSIMKINSYIFYWAPNQNIHIMFICILASEPAFGGLTCYGESCTIKSGPATFEASSLVATKGSLNRPITGSHYNDNLKWPSATKEKPEIKGFPHG